MSTTKTIKSTLDSVKWGDPAPNTVTLYGTVLRTTGNQFGAKIFIRNSGMTLLKEFELPMSDGFDLKFIGKVTIPGVDDFPLHIENEITCSTDFDYSNPPQVSLGSKNINGHDVPICYQSTIFCNDNLGDPHRDMDYKDFVLTWQMYDNPPTD